jgi:hypothetical protein
VALDPVDPEDQLREICGALAEHDVRFVVFGSFAGRLHGADLRTLDVDVVPDADENNLQRLADALNSLEPRWRVAEEGAGMRIDGELEPRHFLGDSLAVGLVTRAGYVDVVLHPKGFEAGYDALAPHAVQVTIGDSQVLVGSLADLIESKQQLAREKDVVHLPELRRRATELGIDVAEMASPEVGRDRSRDQGYDLGI